MSGLTVYLHIYQSSAIFGLWELIWAVILKSQVINV